jgi:hypothetical protein
MHPYPSYTGSVNRRTVIRDGPGIKGGSCLKITKTKRAGDVAQVAEGLSIKYKSLNSTSPARKKLNSIERH